jgi:hypothetical protein
MDAVDAQRADDSFVVERRVDKIDLVATLQREQQVLAEPRHRAHRSVRSHA